MALRFWLHPRAPITPIGGRREYIPVGSSAASLLRTPPMSAIGARG